MTFYYILIRFLSVYCSIDGSSHVNISDFNSLNAWFSIDQYSCGLFKSTSSSFVGSTLEAEVTRCTKLC